MEYLVLLTSFWCLLHFAKVFRRPESRASCQTKRKMELFKVSFQSFGRILFMVHIRSEICAHVVYVCIVEISVICSVQGIWWDRKQSQIGFLPSNSNMSTIILMQAWWSDWCFHGYGSSPSSLKSRIQIHPFLDINEERFFFLLFSFTYKSNHI